MFAFIVLCCKYVIRTFILGILFCKHFCICIIMTYVGACVFATYFEFLFFHSFYIVLISLRKAALRTSFLGAWPYIQSYATYWVEIQELVFPILCPLPADGLSTKSVFLTQSCVRPLKQLIYSQNCLRDILPNFGSWFRLRICKGLFSDLSFSE